MPGDHLWPPGPWQYLRVIEKAAAAAFGDSASDYDRFRPGPPESALDLLLPRNPIHVVDLAAGTGLLTRMLLDLSHEVTAVEPDVRMRMVLAERCPEARVLPGTGEDIPLTDLSVDALVVSSAWHWLDPARAGPEIARVLVPGGRFGVVWTRRDDDVPWVAELDAFVRGLVPDVALREPSYRVDLPDGAPFTDLQTSIVRGAVERSARELVGLYTTYGFFIRLPRVEQTRVRARLEEHITGHSMFSENSRVELPLRSVCWSARRTDDHHGADGESHAAPLRDPSSRAGDDRSPR